MPAVERWSNTAASNGTSDADIGMAELMAAGSLNDGVRGVMAGVHRYAQDTGGKNSLAGGTTAYTLTTQQTLASGQIVDGLRIHVVVNVANTGASTVAVDGTTAKALMKNSTSGPVALSAGDLAVDNHHILEYDASLVGAVGAFVVLNPTSATTSSAPTSASYVTISTDATLTAERTLAAAASLSITDAGAGSTVTVGTAAHTGDVTSSSNSMALTIAANAVSNAKLATMAASTIKANVTGGSAVPTDASMASVVALTSGLTALASGGVALTDQLPIYDISATTGKSATPDKILEVLNLLTEDTSPALSTDFLLSYDTSATTVKKVKPSNLSKFAQVVSAEDSAVATGSTTIPYDDTIPQSTEGDQYITATITPQSATSTLVIQANVYLSPSTAVHISVALFQDAGVGGALAATAVFAGTASGAATIPLVHKMTSGTTSATTFKIRAGPNSAATLTFNGTAGVRKFGGVAASTLTVTEILP